MNCISILSSQLRLSYNNITFAAIKDKKAVTTQFLSLQNPNISKRYYIYIDNIKQFDHPNIKLSNFKIENRNLQIGELWGNQFILNIKDAKENIDFSEIEKGFINYYGQQRFGNGCSVTQKLKTSKQLLHGRISDAIDTLLDPDQSDSKVKFSIFIGSTNIDQRNKRL